jgi:hypothetical protein
MAKSTLTFLRAWPLDVPTAQFTVSYWKVEHALVHVHGIAPDDVSRFRSRFGALQKGGLFGAANQPGKGTKLVYTPDLIHRAVLAIELSQVGVAPAVILRLINDFWDSRLRAICEEAEREVMHPSRGGGDIVLFLAGISLVSEGERAVPNINHAPMRKLSARMELALSGDKLPGRVLVINLTAQLRKFHNALADVHLQPDPEDSPKRAKKSRR